MTWSGEPNYWRLDRGLAMRFLENSSSCSRPRCSFSLTAEPFRSSALRSARGARQARYLPPKAHARITGVQGRHVAILAILATDSAHSVQRRACGAPVAGRSALMDGLHAAGGIDPRTPSLSMASKPAISSALRRSESGRDEEKDADAVPLTPLVERDRKQRVGGLRLPVGYPFVIGARLEIDIVEINARNLMPP